MLFDYSGAIHIHSSYSFDGNVNIEDIIAAAKLNGLDFIVITDHFRIDAKLDGWEGWHDGVLVIVGEEVSPRYNHYLALGLEKPVVAWQKKSKPQEYIDAVNAQGGFGLIAHPDHTGAPKFGVKPYPWTDWSVSGYTGMSVWDMMTDWQEKLTSPAAALWSYIFPTWSLSGPKSETLKRWDELNKERKVLGYGEIDNHNSKKRFGGLLFHIFPFEYAFSTIRTHILLQGPLSGEFDTAKKQVFGALQMSRAYVAQERWRKSKGFAFKIYDDKHTAWCGDEFTLSGRPALLEAKAPARCLIRVLCDGVVTQESPKQYLYTEVERPGVYRIEVQQRVFGSYKPWIYSNPIRVI